METLTNDKHVGAAVLVKVIHEENEFGVVTMKEIWNDVGAVIMCVNEEENSVIIDYPGSVLKLMRKDIKLKF